MSIFFVSQLSQKKSSMPTQIVWVVLLELFISCSFWGILFKIMIFAAVLKQFDLTIGSFNLQFEAIKNTDSKLLKNFSDQKQILWCSNCFVFKVQI